MSEVTYLAWRYNAFHRLKTIVVVLSIAVIIYLPLGLNILIRQSATQLQSRAVGTPLLIGAKGSPLELVLRSLYFASDEPESIPYSQIRRVTDSGLASAVPVYTRFRTPQAPIIGTSLDYFPIRNLDFAQGRPFAMLGECVIGGELARSEGLGIGDHVLSAGEGVFDLAGVYPLKMRVVGILARNQSPDDQGVFVDVKTAWIVQGLGHGHQSLSPSDTTDGVLRSEPNEIVANASVMEYNEITPENAGSFHFHGDTETFPITSIIAVPRSEKANALLQGRYIGKDETCQIVQPASVIGGLQGTIFSIGRYVTLAIILVGSAALAILVLVFVLSVQLRRREFQTMVKIGASRKRIAAILSMEVAVVTCVGSVLAVLASAASSRLAGSVIRYVIDLA